jgi:hypothetical protein
MKKSRVGCNVFLKLVSEKANQPMSFIFKANRGLDIKVGLLHCNLKRDEAPGIVECSIGSLEIQLLMLLLNNII